MATVKLEALRAALDVVKKVAKSTTLPVAASVLVDGRASGLRLSAMDLTSYLTITLSGEGNANGDVYAMLPAARLAKIVAGLGGKKKDITVALAPHASGNVAVEANGRKLQLQTGGDPRNIPAWPVLSDTATIGSQLYGAAELEEALTWVLVAASHDDTRYVLNGVHCCNGLLTATDGHRLHQAPLAPRASTLRVPSGLEAPILPRDSAVVLLTALEAFKPKFGAQVEMRIFKTDASAKDKTPAFLSYARLTFASDIGSVEIVSRLVNESSTMFPNYEAIIPAPSGDAFAAPAAALREALKLAKDLGSDSVVLRAEGSRLTVESSAPDTGKSSEEIALVGTALPQSIRLNESYLLDAVAGCAGNATIQIASAPDRETGEMVGELLCARWQGRTALVMPMKG